MDKINGGFEFVGALLILISCYRLYQDKEIRGVSSLPVLFFTAWGAWNMFYYPSLGQWWSFCGGVCVTTANLLWLALALHYGTKIDFSEFKE